jgi:predicted TIM-barrel enzyme
MVDVVILKEAKKRMPSQRERILHVLRQAGSNGVFNTDLVKLCIGYRSRIAELYQMGYKIEVENVDKGLCIYRLIEEPEEPIKNVPKAISIVVKEIKEKFGGSITADELVELLNEKGFNIVRKHGSHKVS